VRCGSAAPASLVPQGGSAAPAPPSSRIPPREIRIGRAAELRLSDRQVVLEALSALVNLGYSRSEADKAVSRVLERKPEAGNLRVETLLKEALRSLAR